MALGVYFNRSALGEGLGLLQKLSQLPKSLPPAESYWMEGGGSGQVPGNAALPCHSLSLEAEYGSLNQVGSQPGVKPCPDPDKLYPL